MTASPSSTPPRRWRLQFSLRLALLALTAFAIGFPLWYRWPYEEVEVWSAPGTMPVIKKIRTWQRQWGGGRLQHGAERGVVDGKTFGSLVYRRGVKHGPEMRMNDNDKLETVGRYENDLKEGLWVDYSGPFKTTATWRQGQLDGPYEIEVVAQPMQGFRKRQMAGGVPPPEPQKMQLLFAAGRLTQFNGKPARNRLFDLWESGEFDADMVPGSGVPLRQELRRPTVGEFLEVPIRDVMMYLTELHQIPIAIDALVPRPDLAVTGNYQGIDLCSALTLLTAPHNLGCDFRYGMIWITTAKDAEDWHDPTGVAEIEPPKGTALARAWNEPASLEAINQPIGTLLTRLAQPLAIEIDTSQLPPAANQPLDPQRPPSAPASPANVGKSNPFTITANLKGPPFRHVLGYALYQANCRCQLEGDKLIILPPKPEP